MGASPSEIESLTRAERQREVFEWCGRTFGSESQRDRKKRVLRFLEEAIELYQAEGCSLEQGQALMAHVFARPAGEPQQEVGGVSVTLLSYCEAAGLSADECEVVEIARIFNRSAEKARERYQRKTGAGF